MKLQASSIYRQINCPYSAVQEENLPENMVYRTDNPYAAFGRSCHDIAEQELKKFLKTGKNQIKTSVNKVFDKNDPDNIKAYNAVNEYVKYFKNEYKLIKRQTSTQQVIIEEKFRNFSEGSDPVESVMKCDAMIVAKKNDTREMFINIFDLKTGGSDYTESGTEQLTFSAFVFIINQFKKLFKGASKIHIRTHVIQPNYYKEKTIVKRIIINPSDAEELFYKFYIDSIKDDADKCTPGAWCTYCPCMLICPAQQGMAKFCYAVMNSETDFAELPDNVIADLLLNKNHIENFLKKLKEFVEHEVEKGQTFNQFEMVDRKGRRAWTDEKAAQKILVKKYGDDVLTTKLKSVSDIEKLIGKDELQEYSDYYQQGVSKSIKEKKSDFEGVEG